MNILGSTQAATEHRFGDLPVDARIAGALAAMGYQQPTPIQAEAIPALRAGRDVIGLARTGSGKTSGFGIPMIESIRPAERRVQALVLVPTRELAAQVASELSRLGGPGGVRVVAVYGGVGMQPQFAALRGNAHVVVGTPGRVFDHLGRGTLDLRHTRFVVLDEADRMLDVGFAPAIEAILARIPGPRQTALFSATFPTEVEAMAARQTVDAARIAVDVPGAALETLEERFVRVPVSAEKIETLQQILNGPDCKLALVFRRTTHRADKLARDLERRGYKVAALHGRRTQAQRERALGALRAGNLHALVATDIAARGLDITGLTHVVNYDLPDTAENYTHRVGRTARMGAEGVAITLIGPEDEDTLKTIQRKLSPTPARPARGTPQQGRRPAGRSAQPQRQAAAAAKPATPPAHRAAAPADGPQRRQGTATPAGPSSRARQSSEPMREPRPARVAANAAEQSPQGQPAARIPAHAARRAPDRGRVPAATPAGGEQPMNDDGWYPFRLRRS